MIKRSPKRPMMRAAAAIMIIPTTIEICPSATAVRARPPVIAPTAD